MVGTGRHPSAPPNGSSQSNRKLLVVGDESSMNNDGARREARAPSSFAVREAAEGREPTAESGSYFPPVAAVVTGASFSHHHWCGSGRWRGQTSSSVFAS